MSAACLVKDGYPCTTNGECQSDKCSAFYLDADRHSHGSAATAKSVCGSTPPAGYVTSKDDCCDTGGDAGNIFPGQTAWFTSPATSCGKGWDCNCNNNVELEIGALTSACNPNPIGACPQGPAWNQGTVPACGASGSGSAGISPSGAANTATRFARPRNPWRRRRGVIDR